MTGYYSHRFRDRLEAVIADAYADELGLDTVTVLSGFNALGGGQTQAEGVAARIARSSGVQVSAREVMEHDTVHRLGIHLRARTPAGGCVELPPSHRRDGQPTLFYFHSASGNAFAVQTLRHHLPVRVAGIRAAGLYGERPIPRTIEEFGALYLAEIVDVQPEGPYLLSGFSTGGMIAFEVGARLREAGADVGLVAVIDAPPPATAPAGPAVPEEELMDARLRELLRRVGGEAGEPAQVIEQLRAGMALSHDMGADALDRQLRVFARMYRAAELYRPPHYPGPVQYFAAETPDEHVSLWRPYTGALTVHRLRAEHYEYSIFADHGFRSTLGDLIEHALQPTA